MWKLSRRAAAGATIATLTLGSALFAAPTSIARACDDDYRSPVGWGQYPAPGPNVVVVEPGWRDDARYEHWRHEREARRYWYWRGREHAREHYRDRHWD